MLQAHNLSTIQLFMEITTYKVKSLGQSDNTLMHKHTPHKSSILSPKMTIKVKWNVIRSVSSTNF